MKHNEQVINDIILRLQKYKKNVMIDGKTVFDQPVRNNLITHDSI